MTYYQKTLAKSAPELNALHMETLAFAIGSTLNGMPPEFFDDIAILARDWGADKLEAFHNQQVM